MKEEDIMFHLIISSTMLYKKQRLEFSFILELMRKKNTTKNEEKTENDPTSRNDYDQNLGHQSRHLNQL